MASFTFSAFSRGVERETVRTGGEEEEVEEVEAVAADIGGD